MSGAPAPVRSRGILTAGLVVTTFGVALEALSVLPVAPIVAKELPNGIALYGWIFAAFFLGSALAIPVSGRAVDLHGPAPVLIAGLGAFTVGLLIAGLAPAMEVLILGRFVQGTGAGMISAASFATVALAYEPADRPRVLVLLSAAWLLPSFIGPIVGGVVAAVAGWRWVFLGLALLMPLCALLVVPALLGVRASTQVPTPGGWRRWLPPAGEVRRGSAVVLLAATAVLGTITFAPLALSEVRGLDATTSGLTLAVLSVAWTTGSVLQGRTMGRVEAPRVIRGGLALVALGIPIVALTVVATIPLPLTWPGWVLVGLGAGLCFQAANLHVMAASTVGGEGRATASAQLANTLGSAIGAWMTGWALDLVLRSGMTLVVGLAGIFAMTTIAALLGLLVARTLRPVAGRRGAIGAEARSPGTAA
jgi:MFS family permease